MEFGRKIIKIGDDMVEIVIFDCGFGSFMYHSFTWMSRAISFPLVSPRSHLSIPFVATHAQDLD